MGKCFVRAPGIVSVSPLVLTVSCAQSVRVLLTSSTVKDAEISSGTISAWKHGTTLVDAEERLEASVLRTGTTAASAVGTLAAAGGACCDFHALEGAEERLEASVQRTGIFWVSATARL